VFQVPEIAVNEKGIRLAGDRCHRLPRSPRAHAPAIAKVFQVPEIAVNEEGIDLEVMPDE